MGNERTGRGLSCGMVGFMGSRFFTLFATPLGRCGLAWGAHGILAASFSHGSEEETRADLRRRVTGAIEMSVVPVNITATIHEIVKLFSDGDADFSRTELDLSDVTDFDREVLKLTMAIIPGRTRTYGELARDLGNVAFSRRVGQALGRNPIPIIVPCHRVVGAGGMMTGFSAPGGTDTKRHLLKIEGAIGPDLFD